METQKANKTVHSVFTAFFAALISVGAFISIPAGPLGISIVLQNMLCVLSGCILGGIQGAAAVGLFIAAGAVGLPIFAGGNGGFHVLFGPVGGFYYGYFLAALVAGFIAGKPKLTDKKISPAYATRIALASLAGFVLIYAPAIPWAMAKTGKSLPTIFAGYVAPFLVVDTIKMVATIFLSLILRPIAARYLK